ncbi:MAG: hypothetical protein EOP84_11220 [Verrucomicrobiaceae bacterium]|nr:MAG: hypothetical protein EOP84_11220 [Verrucomicrobiaceae bacterium]
MNCDQDTYVQYGEGMHAVRMWSIGRHMECGSKPERRYRFGGGRRRFAEGSVAGDNKGEVAFHWNAGSLLPLVASSQDPADEDAIGTATVALPPKR